MGSAVDKRRKIYSLDSVAAVSEGIAADVFLEVWWGWMLRVVPTETGIVNRCPLLFAGRMCFIPSGVPETAESIAYFPGTVKSAIAAARRPVLLLEI